MSYPLYYFQYTQKAIDALSRAPKLSQLQDCSWPVIGAIIPNTNLLLLALFNCDTPYTGRPVPNPLINQQVGITQKTSQVRVIPKHSP